MSSASKEYDAIVVGAGIAGLACAAALRAHGLEHVLVLEASHHLGGRIRTVREGELAGDGWPGSHNPWLRLHKPAGRPALEAPLGAHNFGFEVGAEFVHGPDTVLGELLRKERIPVKELFSWAHGDGGPSSEAAHDGGIGMYYLGKEKRFERFDQQCADLVHVNEVLWKLGERSAEAMDHDKRSLLQYLKDEGVSDKGMAMAEAGYANTVGGTLRKISAARMCQSERNWSVDGDGDYRVDAGSTLEESVIAALARDVDVKVRTPVSAVSVKGDVFELTSPRGGGTAFRARAVVVTASVSALQRGALKFSPPLPADKQAAISSMECEPALKLLVKFSKRVWPAELHGIVCSDTFAPELWFDGTGPWYATAFFTSDQARGVAAMTTDAAFDALLAQISEMFKCDAATWYQGGFLVDWGAVPYIWGGYTTPSLKELPEARHALASSLYGGRLCFAGEATDPHAFMTAHAAMRTGQRAAGEVVTALRRHPRARL